MPDSAPETHSAPRALLLRTLILGARRIEASLASHFRPLAVSVSDAWVLLLLLEGRETHTTALARALGITSSTMTEVADRLARKGWLERERDPLDRRAVSLRLTAEGNRLALEITGKLSSVEREIAKEITRVDRDGCRRVVEEVLCLLSA